MGMAPDIVGYLFCCANEDANGIKAIANNNRVALNKAHTSRMSSGQTADIGGRYPGLRVIAVRLPSRFPSGVLPSALRLQLRGQPRIWLTNGRTGFPVSFRKETADT